MMSIDQIKLNPEEIWEDIVGYEGIYQVSNLGRVKSLERIDGNGVLRAEKIRNLSESRYGYKVVQLFKGGKYAYSFVHRLVASAFIPNPELKPYVNHRDENKKNNNVNNLEWCDVTYNNNYGNRLLKVRKKLGKPVKSINILTGEECIYMSIAEAASKENASKRHIWSVLKGQRKTHKGKKWEYVNKEAYEMAGEKY